LKHLGHTNKTNTLERAEDLISLFNSCFARKENTILVGNGEEPIYLPANADNQFNQVVFTRDYFSSALHEIAHWCIAGKQRRTKIDYGYWYLPDGRDAQQQASFEAVEVKPQALECAFSLAANVKFRVSIDNLQGEETCSKNFERAVEKQLLNYIKEGFSARAQLFLNALHDFYNTESLDSLIDDSLNNDSFEIKNTPINTEYGVEV
jgi:elongation factor P hydroxylase